MSVYISGPMTGILDYNKPRFDEVATMLRGMGHTVVNPHDISPADGRTYEQALRVDIAALCHEDCDMMVLLPGWQDSYGAKIEHKVAVALGFQIFDYTNGVLVSRLDER